MTKVILLLFIDCLLTRLVFSQYNDGYNRGYNQMGREDEVYERRTDSNSQNSRPNPSEYKEETSEPYQFEYNIDDGYGNRQDRQEKADENGNIVGSYGYLDSNGIYRKVHYTAGPEGFTAKVSSNEPYLKSGANPADVVMFVENPPQNVLNYGRPTNDYSSDEPNDRFDGFESNQMRDQIYRSANRVRPQTSDRDKRFFGNDDNDYGFRGMKPLLQMLRHQHNRHQEFVQPIDTFRNHRNRIDNNDNIEAYASNRRYFD